MAALVRRQRAWTMGDVGARMRAEGFDGWNRGIVANLESLRRRDLSVDEALGLSRVLGVPLLHMIVPIHARTWQATPTAPAVPADTARAWLVGDDASLCHDEDWYWHHRPIGRFGGSKIVEHAADRQEV
jgi:hypothetical protein